MKLIMIVAGDEFVEEITTLLVNNGYFATNIGSSGDFLQYGNTVLMMGVQDNQVNDVMDLLTESSKSSNGNNRYRDEVEVFVINIENHFKTNAGVIK